jgi:hypothetical protein
MFEITLVLDNEDGGDWFLEKKVKMPFVPVVGTTIRGEDPYKVDYVEYELSTGKIEVWCNVRLFHMCLEYISGGWEVDGKDLFAKDTEAQAKIEELKKERC